MRCKRCGQPLDEEGQLGLCESCWEELCEMTCWEQFNIVAEGAD